MSDEEKHDEVYVRHPPFYRSDALTKFISKLDKRCDKMSTHPRIKRNVGSPAKTPTPANAKKWTVKKINDTVSDESTRSTPRGLPTTPLADDVGDIGNETEVEDSGDSEFDVSSDIDHESSDADN